MRLEEKFWEIIKKQQTDRPTECVKIAEDFAIRFADWKDKLKPSQKVSFWSKNGEHKGKFDMDNEQLLEIFKRECSETVA